MGVTLQFLFGLQAGNMRYQPGADPGFLDRDSNVQGGGGGGGGGR